MDEEVQIPVERADKRYFTLGRKPGGGSLEKNVPHVAAIEPRGLISDVVMQEAALHIYLRSVVQVLLFTFYLYIHTAHALFPNV
jgi:hypothetical protein